MILAPQIAGTLSIRSTADVRGYITAHSTARLPRLSIDQNLLIAWAMVLFWGFAWPWLLVALHKHPLRRLIVRLVSEMDAAAASRNLRRGPAIGTFVPYLLPMTA
jgi:hypothetical protein